MRQRVYSGAPWEPVAGYCRAVRDGREVFVSGTAPVDADGRTHAPGDAYAQTRRCLAIVETALQGLGAGLKDVVRTRMFVTDIVRFAEYAKAHGEVFRDFPPVTSMVEVKALVAADMLIEIEADARVGEAP